MGYYAIAIGGTGNKILESVVYGACVDALYTVLGNGKKQPIPKVELLSVDVDAACGNTTRAKQAAEHYERVRKTFSKGQGRRGFHTKLHVERWNMNLSKRATSVDRMVENHRRDQLLARTLFDQNESSLEYSEGFRGHPDLGVLFFSDLLKGISQVEACGQPDEMVRMLHEMQEDIARGERVKVILCGSIFGGTGAAGIPAVSRFLRERFREHGQLFELAAILMLPYYKVPPSSRSEELEIVVKSSNFLDKARTALQYYGMEGMIKSGEEDEQGIYDSLYLLGMPPEAFVSTRIYSTGSQSQENDAHMLEWLAMRCIARFFRTSFRGEDAGNIDCYYYQLHSRTFGWNSFDDEEDAYRAGYGGLIKASVAFFAECYPYLHARITGEKRMWKNVVSYYAAWFSGVSKLSAQQHAVLEKNLDALYHCLAFYCNWMYQIVKTMPPTLRGDRASEEAARDAAERYERLLDRHVLLMEREEQKEEKKAGNRALREEYEQMVHRQREDVQLLGGALYLEMVKGAQSRQREALLVQESAAAELAERIALWHGEDAALIEPHFLQQEEERLDAMRRVQESMRARQAKISEDIRDAVRENILSVEGKLEKAEEGSLPENDLFSPRLLLALNELLRQYGMKREAREYARIDKLGVQLQRGLNRLVVSHTPDAMDMSRVIASVSNGVCRKRDPDAMLSGFWGALLGAVLQEEGI